MASRLNRRVGDSTRIRRGFHVDSATGLAVAGGEGVVAPPVVVLAAPDVGRVQHLVADPPPSAVWTSFGGRRGRTPGSPLKLPWHGFSARVLMGWKPMPRRRGGAEPARLL